MGERTDIAWCTSSWSPWIGCTEVSPGCDACYARVLDARYRYGGAVHWGTGVPRHRTSESTWKRPLTWDNKAFVSGERWTVFPSLCDPFDNEVPVEWRNDFWHLISATPSLTWLLLTKRIGNAAKMVPWTVHPWSNVWIGASVVNQEEANRDIQKLVATPAAKRFVSYEPALNRVDWCEALEIWWNSTTQSWVREDLPRPDWVIVGGESDQGKHKARPFDLAWARSTVRQCRAAGVPVFVKQLGSNPFVTVPDHPAPAPGTPAGFPRTPSFKDRAGADPAEWPEDLRVQEFPA